MATILSRMEDNDDEDTKGWASFMVEVRFIYKKARGSAIHKGRMPIMVPLSDLACKCPKIKMGK